jgi:hypothetical protein
MCSPRLRSAFKRGKSEGKAELTLRRRTREAIGVIIDGMDIAPSNAPTANVPPKVIKTHEGIDVAARYFVYKLYEATDGQPMQWQLLHGMGESAATISGAVERGWVILQDLKGKPLERKAALTDEGRRLARKGR